MSMLNRRENRLRKAGKVGLTSLQAEFKITQHKRGTFPQIFLRRYYR
jgi:hypothetical protein